MNLPHPGKRLTNIQLLNSNREWWKEASQASADNQFPSIPAPFSPLGTLKKIKNVYSRTNTPFGSEKYRSTRNNSIFSQKSGGVRKMMIQKEQQSRINSKMHSNGRPFQLKATDVYLAATIMHQRVFSQGRQPTNPKMTVHQRLFSSNQKAIPLNRTVFSDSRSRQGNSHYNSKGSEKQPRIWSRERSANGRDPELITLPRSIFTPKPYTDYVSIYSQNMAKDLKLLRDFRVKLIATRQPKQLMSPHMPRVPL